MSSRVRLNSSTSDMVLGLSESLYGTYYGNSKSNTFIAKQSVPPKVNLDYSLEQYHYALYGEAGNVSSVKSK